MKILVTGCTGFIGSYIVRALTERRDKVSCISRSLGCPQGGHTLLDLSKELDRERLPDSIDCILHLAATMDKEMAEDEMFRINTLASLNLLSYAKGIKIKRFILASTGGVYGYSQKEAREDSPVNPNTFYGVSKYLSESLASYFSRFFGVVVLRYFFPYGKGQERGIIPMLSRKIKDREPIFLEGREGLRINPIHISDAVELTMRAIDLEENLGVFNIAGPLSLTIKELADMIGGCLGVEPLYEYRDETSLCLVGDTSKTERVLGYPPRISINKEVLQEIIG